MDAYFSDGFRDFLIATIAVMQAITMIMVAVMHDRQLRHYRRK